MAESVAVDIRTEEEGVDIDTAIQADDSGARAVPVGSTTIDFSSGTTAARVQYYRILEDVARNMHATRYPTYDTSKCSVEVKFVKLTDVPLAFNPVRALVLTSSFDAFPSNKNIFFHMLLYSSNVAKIFQDFRLVENCAYRIQPEGKQVPQLISHEDYADDGRCSHGVARMYLKERRTMWEGKEHTEFAFANLVQDNLKPSYKCCIWPPNKFDTVNSRKRVLQRMTMYSEDKEKKTSVHLHDKRLATPGSVRALTFRHMNERTGQFDDDKYDFPKAHDFMQMKLGENEIGLKDKFGTYHWKMEDFKALLYEHRVCENGELSEEQWTHALRAFRHTVSFIQGPPGCGKTKVLAVVSVALAIRLKQIGATHPQMGKQPADGGAEWIPSHVINSVVAVVTKSNKACEVVVARLKAMWPNFVWVTSHLRQRTVTDPSSLHMMAASRLKTNLEFTAWFHQYQTGTDLYRDRGHRGFLRLLQWQMQDVLNSVDIVVSTVRRMESLKSKHFSLWMEATMIDEASQLDELEACAALTLYSHRICLCGDSKQLGPIYVRNEPKYRELSEQQKYDLEYAHVGWFNRIVEAADRYSTWKHCFKSLTTLYRMPWPQTEFVLQTVYEDEKDSEGRHIFRYKYDSKSFAAFNTWPHKLEYNQIFDTDVDFFKRHQIAFIDTDEHDKCEESTGRDGSSLRNTGEAEMAVELAKNAMQQYQRQKLTVAIISMYNEQLYYIEQLLHRTDNISSVILSSVDGFQGAEADVVIISTVRKNERREIGFLAIQQRANVALSRSRKVLVVLGSGKTLSKSSLWADFVRYGKNKDELGNRYHLSAKNRLKKVASRK